MLRVYIYSVIAIGTYLKRNCFIFEELYPCKLSIIAYANDFIDELAELSIERYSIWIRIGIISC